VPGHDAVPENELLVQAELRGTVRDERIQLDERPGVEQQVEALARRELAPGVLAIDAGRSPTEQGLGSHALESIEALVVRTQAESPVSVHKDGCIIARGWFVGRARLAHIAVTDIHRFGEQLQIPVDKPGADPPCRG
jgi:hypothetical protein